MVSHGAPDTVKGKTQLRPKLTVSLRVPRRMASSSVPTQYLLILSNFVLLLQQAIKCYKDQGLIICSPEPGKDQMCTAPSSNTLSSCTVHKTNMRKSSDSQMQSHQQVTRPLWKASCKVLPQQLIPAQSQCTGYEKEERKMLHCYEET